ncbi:MAG: PDZ domain-containing protein [Candidatus Hydrogenedentes bacterium]|nr:PDZ domain-containing protein [Candidatus Hydrogenedentota bacterium]
MNGVNIGLFDFDWHNALYFFALNADDQIYLRYGGRDETSPEAYLDLDSLELALQQGLEQHHRYQDGKLPRTPRPEPMYPRDIPLLKSEVVAQGRCVECHLIADYMAQEREFMGTLDKKRDLFVYPDIRRIGIHLDIPKGLEVEEATGPVAAGGMRAGDTITGINGTPVLTYGDLQHHYNTIPRDAQRVGFTVSRDGTETPLTVNLPDEWWYTDLYHRYLSIDPVLYFSSRPLTTDEKRQHGFDPEGFASEVTRCDPGAKVYKMHELLPGDIIYSVNGIEADAATQNLEIYIKMNTISGDRIRLGVIREGERIAMDAHTLRQGFRKPQW